MSLHNVFKITQRERDEAIDRVLSNLAYGLQSEFEHAFGSWDSQTPVSSYYMLYYSVHDEMVHEGLIESEKRTKKDKAYYRVKLTVVGNRIKQSGGWLKHKRRQRLSLIIKSAVGTTAFVLTLFGIVEFFRSTFDTSSEIQRLEFVTNNPPQLELWYSAFHPGNRDPLLKQTPLDDTTGITGSYRLTNKGRAIITLEKIELPNIFKTRGYFVDRVVSLPYPLSPNDTIVISCEIPGNERPIIETEDALKRNVVITCAYPEADIRYSYKFYWEAGLFKGRARIIE